MIVKKTIENLIESKISTDLTYNDLKDKINVKQYVSSNPKYKMSLSLKFVSILSSFVILLIGGFLILNMNRINYINNEITLYENDKEWIDAHDYVFVAKVEDLITTKKYDGTGTDIPYTFYKIKIIDYLKGEGSNTGTICFYGGIDYLNTWTLYRSNDEVLEINKYYLFFTNKKSESSKNDRIGKNDFIITRNDQKIVFSEYNENKGLNEQSENIQKIIKRYTNIINKVTNYDIQIPSFDTIKEMVNYFDYVFIAKITSDYRSNEVITDIPTVNYNYSLLESFKYDLLLPKKLYYFGVNYWYDEKSSPNGLQLPEVDGVYLIFANKNPDNEKELLILANYQLIKLDNYNVNLSYQDQSDNIKELVSNYIKHIERIDE